MQQPLRFPYIERLWILRRLDAAIARVSGCTDRNRGGKANGFRHGHGLHRAHRRVLRRDRGPASFLRATHGQGRQAMNWVYWLSGLAALGIFIYLLIALFKPEIFS